MSNYSEAGHYYSVFAAEVRRGEFCEGETCRVWFLSEVDTWHACSCNGAKGVPHPEADEVSTWEAAGLSPAPYVAAPAVSVDNSDDIPFLV